MRRLGPEASWRSPEGQDDLACARARKPPPQQEHDHTTMERYMAFDAHASSCMRSEGLCEVRSSHAQEVVVAAASDGFPLRVGSSPHTCGDPAA